MIELLTRIGDRLRAGEYPNEASVSHGIVMPVLAALGWDTSDPRQVSPEHTNPRGRVDFALIGHLRRPAVFIEVKAVNRLGNGDRQLFEYAFHEGVPLCVLTDGREWNFYFPSGQGSYTDRRVYSLQLDVRQPTECAEILERYLRRDRVLDERATEDARRDLRDAYSRAAAVSALPAAWDNLVTQADEATLDRLLAAAEAISGFRPSDSAALDFLQRLTYMPAVATATATAPAPAPANDSCARTQPPPADTREISYTLHGERHVAANASRAMVDILKALVSRDPSQLPRLQAAVRSRGRAHIGRSAEEINPARPDLARPEPIHADWSVGLTVSNQTKMMIIRAACEVYGLSIPRDLDISLPNG